MEKEKQFNSIKADDGPAHSSAVFATISGFLRLMANQVVFNMGYTDQTSLPCEVAVDISIICYSFTMFGAYMFLWFRQRSLYEHPSMQEQSKRWLKRFSWMSAIIVVGGGVFVWILFSINKRPPTQTTDARELKLRHICGSYT